MQTALPSRREVKKETTRQRIIEAGVRIFTGRGIESARVDEIAAAADVGKGTIYNYFATKEDIVVAFMVDLERQIQEKAVRLSESKEPLERLLTQFVKYHLQSKELHHKFVRVLLGQMFMGGEAFLPRIVELQAVTDPPLETLFTRLRERGLIRKDVPLADLILLFKTTQLGLTSLWVIEGPPWKRTYELVALQMKVFCQGIGKGER